MILNKVLIRGFRSVKDPCNLIIDNRITILIGANDHGKSNLLSSINALNGDPEFVFKTEDRHWDLEDADVPRVEWHFTFTDEEFELLRNALEYKPTTEATDTPTANTGDVEAPPSQPQSPPPDLFNISSLRELIYYREGFDQPVKVLETPFAIEKSKENILLEKRPKVELFKPADVSFIDTVSAAQIEDPKYEVMKGIFILAEIWDKRTTIFTQNPTTEKQLETASEILTDKLQKQWIQGEKHKWRLLHENGVISLRINDVVVKKTYVKPSQRSSGFRTYFYLCMAILARNHQLTPDKKFIYLFDEPGTYLHPKAQIDLQRSFENIADNSQLIYSTHSLFLISKNYPKRNRVVQKTIDGTLIDHKPFADNWKSVRSELGIIMSNNFLIADKSLLVEGRSDVLYITNAVRQMKEKSQVDIDMNDFTIMDAGDSSNYTAMAKLMMNDGRFVYCLVDNDDGGNTIKGRVEKITDRQIKVQSLPRANTSTEDVFVDEKILRSAIRKVIEDLLTTEEREIKPIYLTDRKLNDAFTKELAKIKRRVTQTLGTTLRKSTSSWFTDGEELSKVSVAMKYITLCEDSEHPPDDQSTEAVSLMKSIKQVMALKGEKEYESGVYEVVGEK